MTQRIVLIISSMSGLLAVGIGAFGAHAFKGVLSANGRTDTYELASRYHFYHTLALLATGLLMGKFPGLGTSAISFLVGTVIFSGSLYTLALSGQTWLGAVTPVGGVFLLLGWGSMAWAIFKN